MFHNRPFATAFSLSVFVAAVPSSLEIPRASGSDDDDDDEFFDATAKLPAPSPVHARVPSGSPPAEFYDAQGKVTEQLSDSLLAGTSGRLQTLCQVSRGGPLLPWLLRNEHHALWATGPITSSGSDSDERVTVPAYVKSVLEYDWKMQLDVRYR